MTDPVVIDADYVAHQREWSARAGRSTRLCWTYDREMEMNDV